MMESVRTAENLLLQEQARNRLYPDVHFGGHVIVGSNVTIGAGSIIGHHVSLGDDTIIGLNVRIDSGTSVGKLPMRSKNSAITKDIKLPPATIGDGCILGTNVVVYRGALVLNGVLLADASSIRELSVIGDLTIIGRGVAVENEVRIGRCCKIETGAYITALSTIHDLCFVAPEVTFTNDNYLGRTEERFKHFRGVTMERGARIGANATVLPGLVLGSDCLVAAGSVVTRDVPPCMIVMGSPARVVRAVPPEQLLAPEAGKTESCSA